MHGHCSFLSHIEDVSTQIVRLLCMSGFDVPLWNCCLYNIALGDNTILFLKIHKCLPAIHLKVYTILSCKIDHYSIYTVIASKFTCKYSVDEFVCFLSACCQFTIFQTYLPLSHYWLDSHCHSKKINLHQGTVS